MSLTIAELGLSNFKCFAGKHVLKLEPKAYGIFARYSDDAGRSNWAGKTALTEAIDLALTGRRPRDARVKSDWITNGEEKGEVDLTFSSGARVVRSMSRKGSERLFYFPPGDPEHGATQDVAQKLIDELLGLTKEDAGTWCFRQGEMSALLKMDPGPRMEMFSAWFGLEKLEECQALAASARASIEKDKAEATKVLESWQNTRQHQIDLANLAPEQTFAEAIDDAVIAEGFARRDADIYERELTGIRERQELSRDVERHDQYMAEGKAVAQILREMPTAESLEAERIEVAKEVEEYTGMASTSAEAHRQLAVVASGNFDGVCPLAGAACPSAEFVTSSVRTNQARNAEVRAHLDEVSLALSGARQRHMLVLSKIRDREHAEGRIRELRAAVGPLIDRKKRWQALGELSEAGRDTTLGLAPQRFQVACSRLGGLRSAALAVGSADVKIAEARAEVERLEKVAEIPSAAALVFERARKQIAEGVLAEIEEHANEMLTAIGADLTVAISWGRDGSGLADACSKCGAAFPKSLKVKDCSRCGSARTQKLVERLDIDPSRRSGAADDFGSIAVTLGASRWLREDRGSEWATATLDEPSSQMDASNRHAFAVRLPAVLKLAGFDQVFCVSHHRETLECLDGRIEIVSKDGCSTVRVVS